MKRAAPWILLPLLVGCTPTAAAPSSPREARVAIQRVERPAEAPPVAPILDNQNEREEEVIAATDL